MGAQEVDIMTKQIFVNLPVRDLDKSTAFFKNLGYKFDPRFTDKNAACMIVSENVFVMLLVEGFFKTFTKKALCDATKATEVLVCLALNSRGAVNEMVAKAVAGGGTTPNASNEHGFMYEHGFQDLDGHLWELVYMEAA